MPNSNHRSSAVVRLVVGAVLSVALSIPVNADPPAALSGEGSIVVPLHVERGPWGDVHLGIDVTVDDTTSRVLLSTATMGLHILAARVGSAARRTGQDAATVYSNGLSLHGAEAKTTLRIGTAHADDVPIALVDSYDCSPERPHCPAANLATPEMFGTLFPGILGIGLMAPTPSRCCGNPLPSLAGGVGRSYIVRANFAGPTLTLNPDAATVTRFTMVEALQDWTWGCISIEGAQPNQVCGGVMFDTSSPQMHVTTTGVGHPGVFPNHTPVTLRVGDFSHAFDIGPETPRHLIIQRGSQNAIVVGLAYMQDLDLYYDFATNRIGLAASR